MANKRRRLGRRSPRSSPDYDALLTGIQQRPECCQAGCCVRVEKVPRSRRYRLVGKVYSVCLVFLKLFGKIYAPLTVGLMAPFRSDRILAEQKRCQLDRLYQRICDNLDALLREVGFKIAA
jgi:Lon protease-like protein